jgi:hypothetical protein
MATRVDVKILTANVIPVIGTLLKDETLEVRLGVMQHISSLITELSNEDIRKYIFPLFANIERDR